MGRGKCALCGKIEGKDGGSFYKAPKDDIKRQRWSANCGVVLSQKALVCEGHFREIDFVNAPGSSKIVRLQPGAMPLRQEQDESLEEIEHGDGDFNKTDCGTQTDNDIRSTYILENIVLKEQLKKLEMENKQIKIELENAKSLIYNLTKIFSKGQIERLTNPVNKNHWNWEDISQAICLHAAGPRAYRHLYNKGYPLPHDSTLRKWAQKIEMSEGVLWFSLDIMRNSTELTKDERICVLIFDEMKVTEVFEYDPSVDAVRKPSNYVQVAIVRGLKKSWKQPVFYSFDCPMTKEIVYLLIRELSERDYAVVAMVSDMGSCNRKLWKDLNVTIKSPWFVNPACLDEKVFVFADPPHLIKLIRNHYFDTGLLWNGTLLTNRTLIDLVRILSGSDLSIAYKLTEENLSARGASRQKVKLASQVFSNTNANAIRRCYYLGEDLYSPLESADCLQLVNDWFDVLNSKMTTFSLPGKKPYGKDLVHQDEVLKKMNEWMSQNIVPGKKSVQIFQQGVLVTNNALQLLYEYLSERQQEVSQN